MKKCKKVVYFFCVAIIICLVLSTSDHPIFAKGKKCKIHFTNVSKKVKLPLKSTNKIRVKYYKKKASYRTLWKSSKPKIVHVSSKGTLSPRKKGTSTITHIVKTKKGKVVAKKSIKVTVTPEIRIRAISCREPFSSFTTLKYPYKYKWKLSLTPTNAALKSITFQSSNPKIATVSKTGIIKPLRKGKVTITAKSKYVKLKRNFQVQIPLKKMTAKYSNIKLPFGKSQTLSVSLSPKNTSERGIRWTSNNTTVAVVDQKGCINTRGVGTAIITACSIQNPSKKCNFYITVTADNGLLSTNQLDSFQLKDGDHLMIVAHPDDEMLWGGGNMIQEINELQKTGHHYFVVCLTNGSYDSRARDFDSAMKDVGAKHTILRYPDLYRNRQVKWDTYANYIKQDIRRVLSYRNWGKIVTHNPEGEYGHQHHINTNVLVSSISQEKPINFDKLYYFGKFYSESILPNFINEKKLSPEIAKQKHNIIFKNYADRGAIYMYEYFNDYENWIKASEWK